MINQNGYDGFTLDIQIYKNYGNGHWAQERYLVHGIDDVFWTSSIEDAVAYIKSDLEKYEQSIKL